MSASSYQDSLLEQGLWFLQRGKRGIPDRNFYTERIEKSSVKFSSIFPVQSTNNNPEDLAHLDFPTCFYAIPCYGTCIFRVTLIDVITITLYDCLWTENNKTTSSLQIVTVPENHRFITGESGKRLLWKVTKLKSHQLNTIVWWSLQPYQ